MENIAKVTSPIPLKVKEARIKATLKAKEKTKERKEDFDTLTIITGGPLPTTREPMENTTSTTLALRDSNSLGKAKEKGLSTIKAKDVDELGPVATSPATTLALTPTSIRSPLPLIPTLPLNHSGRTTHLSNGLRITTISASFFSITLLQTTYRQQQMNPSLIRGPSTSTITLQIPWQEHKLIYP
jgi:hypothetical protein